MAVIGAGFGRTGTLSMKAALERLGYVRTHHMEEVFRSRKQIDLWHDVGRGAEPQWDDIFVGYQACVDFPSSTYYREILAHYPDAKVVLTTRDPDRWYASAAATIFRARELTPAWAVRFIPAARKMFELTEATVWDRLFDGRFADEAFAKQVFVNYIEQVKADVPADRLLVFEVAQGWEPLCEFLDCDVPDEPFPHVNDTESFNRKVRGLRLLGAAPYGAAALAAAAAIRSPPR